MPEIGGDADAAPASVREDETHRFGAVVRRGRDAHVEVAQDHLRPARDGPHVREERPRESAGHGRSARRVNGDAAPAIQVQRGVDVVRVLVREEDRGNRVQGRSAQGEAPLRLFRRETRVHEDASPVRANDRAVPRRARAEEADLDAAHCAPVLPKPPAPRAVSTRSAAPSKIARATGATTSCAIRSPRAQGHGLRPEVHDENADLAAVVRVDRPDAVREREPLSQGEAGAGAHLAFEAPRDLENEVRWEPELALPEPRRAAFRGPPAGRRRRRRRRRRPEGRGP